MLIIIAQVGGAGGKGQPDCFALSVLPGLFAEAGTLGKNSEEAGSIPLAASGASVPWICRVTGSTIAGPWDWEEGTAA